MERVIVSPTLEPARRRGSLTRRILLVNLIALLLFGGALFYLDGFRVRLIAERRAQKEAEVALIATVLARTPPELRRELLVAIAMRTRDHLRVFDREGRIVLDSWRLARFPRSSSTASARAIGTNWAPSRRREASRRAFASRPTGRSCRRPPPRSGVSAYCSC